MVEAHNTIMHAKSYYYKPTVHVQTQLNYN
jgi:hypothetical protein